MVMNMRLFHAIEKCFPEMRKHKDWLWKQHPPEYWKDEEHLLDLKEEMKWWIIQQYLHESSVIYQLFHLAGVKSKSMMATEILGWHIYDWNIENKLKKVSRTSTSPAQK